MKLDKTIGKVIEADKYITNCECGQHIIQQEYYCYDKNKNIFINECIVGFCYKCKNIFIGEWPKKDINNK